MRKRPTVLEAIKQFGITTPKPGQIIGERLGGEPENEFDHFYTCSECRQPVDKRDLGEVLHHEIKEHAPLRRRRAGHRTS